MTAGWETRDGRADMTNFEMDLFDTRMTNPLDKDDDDDCCKHSIIKPACLPITILLFLLMMTFFIPLFNDESETLRRYERTGICTDNCKLQIVESIPSAVIYPGYTPHISTFDAWSDLLDKAKHSIDMSVLYWNMKDASSYETAWQGNKTFYKIVEAAKRGVTVRIVQNSAGFDSHSDADYLAKNGLAEVRRVNFTELFGSGVLHTKMWIVDQKHVYVGSANMDWKSLTEVKELGVVVRNCSCIAYDISKIFTVYWRLGEEGAKIPIRWPINLRTNFNFQRPLQIEYNGRNAFTFISSSPPDFNPKGREYDLNAIVRIMRAATKTIRLSVMDYYPATLYMPPGKNHYFGDIDDAIREAAFRGVTVYMLIGEWEHSMGPMKAYLRSLLQLNDALLNGRIYVKMFTIPKIEKKRAIPYTRVNHNKYMVTDDTVYIGTSNWAGDYFITTAGIGFVVQAAPPARKNSSSQVIVNEFTKIFDRDWNSQYAHDLELYDFHGVSPTPGDEIV